jgi:hypothetical protein
MISGAGATHPPGIYSIAVEHGPEWRIWFVDLPIQN